MAKPQIVRAVWRGLYVRFEVEDDGAVEVGLILVLSWVLGSYWFKLILYLNRRRFAKARGIE